MKLYKRLLIIITSSLLVISIIGLSVECYINSTRPNMKESFIDEKILKEFGVDDLNPPKQTAQLSWDNRYTCKVENEQYYFTYVEEVFSYLQTNEKIKDTYFMIDEKFYHINEFDTYNNQLLYHSSDVYDYYSFSSYTSGKSTPREHDFVIYYSLKDDQSNIYSISIEFEFTSFGFFWDNYGIENNLTISLHKCNLIYLYGSTKVDDLQYNIYKNYVILSDNNVQTINITEENYKEYFNINYSFNYNIEDKMSLEVEIKNNYKTFCNVSFQIIVKYNNEEYMKVTRLNNSISWTEFIFALSDVSIDYNVEVSLYEEGNIYLY